MSKAKDVIKMLEKQGQATGREGVGGTDVCVCPECGKEFPHDRGVPCNELDCPDCNVPLTGKGTPGGYA